MSVVNYMNLVFYDRHGRATAYTEDGENIYHFNGRPVAYIEADTIYSFSGIQLGWFEDGWIRNLKGECVFFTENAVGGPIKPIRQIVPIKCVKQIRPIKQIKQLKRLKVINSLSWSDHSGESFFSFV